MSQVRSLSVILFMAVGLLLLLSANLGVWVERNVYNTDGFVSTTAPVFQNKDVQAQLATDISTQIFAAADLAPRLQEQLPAGLKFLALPITNSLQDFLERLTLQVLQTDRFQSVVEQALRGAHTQIRRIILSDHIKLSGDTITIDLRPILNAIVDDIGLGDALSNNNDKLLANIDLPPTAGQIEVSNATASWVFRIAHFGQKVIVAVVAATVVAFGAALLLARDRRRALSTTGILFVVAGFVSLVLLVPVRYVGGEAARNKDAALAVISILTFQFRLQSGLLVLFGLVCVGTAFLLSDSRLARGLRSVMTRRTATAQEPLTDVIRDYAGPLRMDGIVITVVLLLAWPDPSTRVQLTLLGLLVAYLCLVWLMTSTSEMASRTRSGVEGTWRQYVLGAASSRTAGSGVRGWIAVRAGTFRVAGVLLASAVLILAPALNFQTVVTVVLLLLAYIAGVEFVSNH